MKNRVFVTVGIMSALLPTALHAAGTGDRKPEAGTAAQVSPEIREWAQAVRDRFAGETLTMAATRHPSVDAMQEMVGEFTAVTGIDVQWDIIEESYLRNKLLIEAQNDTAVYDVLLVDAFSLAEYVPADVVLPLDRFVADTTLTPEWYDFDDILGAYRNGIGRYQDVLYGIPIAGETRYVAYRTDLFERYAKQPPETMEELLDLAEFFTGREEGLYGIAMRAQRGIHFASGFLTTMYQNGGQLVDQNTWEVLVDDPATVESLDYYVKLLDYGPPDIANYTHEEAVSAFSLGKTALWFDATALTPWILDPEKSLVTEQVGFVPPPEGRAGAYGVLAGWNIGISPDIDGDRQDAAWAFVVWMTSRRNAEEYVRLGGTPVRESVFRNPELVEENWTFPVQLESLNRAENMVNDGILWLAPHPEFIKILETVGNYGSQALARQITVQEALARAQQDSEEIMGK